MKINQQQQESQINSFKSLHDRTQEIVIYSLETIQDLIVVLLCIGLFGVMFVKIKELFTSLIPPLDFQAVTPDILFILILVEIFRLLIIYLQEKEIAVGVAVEIAIVSILREIILRGVLEIPNAQIWAICGILFVLGLMLIIPAIKMILSKAIMSSYRRVLSNSNSGLFSNNKKTLLTSPLKTK